MKQAVQKGPSASLRSIASRQRTRRTPPLIDLSRASHVDLFEQPVEPVIALASATVRTTLCRVDDPPAPFRAAVNDSAALYIVFSLQGKQLTRGCNASVYQYGVEIKPGFCADNRGSEWVQTNSFDLVRLSPFLLFLYEAVCKQWPKSRVQFSGPEFNRYMDQANALEQHLLGE